MQRGRGVFWCGFRRDPPERQLIAPLYSGGQSGEVVWDAFVSFGFCGLMLFCCFSVGLKTFDCSFAFDLSELIAPLGLHARRTRLFSHALLKSVELAGHRRLPARR